MKKGIGAMLLTLPLLSCGATLQNKTEASANSAPAYWSGADGSGVIAVWDEGECPVRVNSETLTFRIPDLPFESMEGYASTVTAEYELYNPTSRDVELTLFFPLGTRPDYYEAYRENGTPLPGLEGYHVTAEGEGGRTQQLSVSFRHTYAGSRKMDFSNGMPADAIPSDTCTDDGFFAPDMSVTKYSYRVTAPREEEYYTFCFIYDCNPRKTQVFCESGVTGTTNDGRGVAYANLRGGETREINFYAVYDVGGQLEPGDIQPRLCAGSGSYSVEAEGGKWSLLTLSERGFYDFVQSFRPDGHDEFGTVSETDWYNAVVAMLSDGESGALFLSEDLPLLDNLMFWCEYSLVLPAKSTVVNSVTAPLYPGIEGSRPDYTFEYMLSPALYWADFGDITIRVETPYFLTWSSLAFEQEENGYVYTKDSLPMCDLSFTIRKSAAAPVPYDPYNNITPTIVTALGLLAGVIVLAAVIIVVALHVQRRNKKQLAEQLGRGRAQEGFIDLPDTPEQKHDRK